MITFDGVEIDVLIDTDDNIWFSALQIARVLEYKEPKASIKKGVNRTDRQQFRHIKKLIDIPKNIHPQTVFISEAGL